MPIAPRSNDALVSDAKLKLKVLSNPIPTFYKDEGGKTNHMVATLCLDGDLKAAAGMNFGGKVEAKLFYENGNAVEDGDEIFRVLSTVPEFVTSADQKITVKFRIEKVSRRKDGQRFKVLFHLDKNVTSVFTSPVCVLSKRKNQSGCNSVGNNGQNTNMGNIQPKARSNSFASTASSMTKGMSSTVTKIRSKSLSSTASTLTTMSACSSPYVEDDSDCSPKSFSRRSDTIQEEASGPALDALRKTVAALQCTVQKLAERVQVLESEQVDRKRRRLNEPIVSPSSNRFDLASYDDSDDLSDIVDEDFEPHSSDLSSSDHVKKEHGAEISFNFGLPSSELDYNY